VELTATIFPSVVFDVIGETTSPAVSVQQSFVIYARQ